MNSRRIARASEAVREVASTTILFTLRDPRIKQVTVLGAEVAKDMRTAKVYVSVMGDAKQQSLAMHGLESARGFIQAKIAERLDTKYTPVLKFVLDQGVKKSIEMSQMLRETLPADAAAETAFAEDAEADEGDDVADDDDADLEQLARVDEPAGDIDRAQEASGSNGARMDAPRTATDQPPRCTPN